MYKKLFNKQTPIVFRHFANKGYSLFAVLGREVLIGTLSVATLSCAEASTISTQTFRADGDTLKGGREQLLDEVSVTASRAPLEQSKQARMVTVLGKDDIARVPVQSVNDLVKYAVGVDVRQRGALGAQTDVSIRGGSYEDIAILIDGINIGDPQTGHNSFDFPVDISDIERIEVLEGPTGRVYGTSSLLGAINIVTKKATTNSLSAHAEGGSYGYFAGGARGALSSGRWGHTLSASYTRSDGYTRNKAGGLNSDLQTVKAFYRGSYSNDDVSIDWHAGMSTKDFGSNTFYGAKWDDQFEHTFKTYTAVQATTRRGRFHFHPAIYWNRNMDRFELFRDAPEKYPFNYHRTDVIGLNLNAYLDWALGRTAIGAEIRNEDIVSTNLGEELTSPKHIHGEGLMYTHGLNRTNMQFVVEHNIVLKRFTLSAGVIAVKNTNADMNMRVYPGIDISYRIGEAWKVYASYNSSLRMPSFTELYYSVGGHKADKNLKPEELSAVEIGARYVSNGLRGSLSVYHNHRRNLIDWVRNTREGDDAFWRSVNFGVINAIGVEANMKFDFTHLLPGQRFLRSLSLGYNYISQNRKEEDGIQSRYALEYLRNKFVAGVEMNIWRKLFMNIDYRLQNRTGSYTATDGSVKRYGTYGIANARMEWKESRWKVFIDANNIFDKEFVDFGSIPEPGFWIIGGIKVNIP